MADDLKNRGEPDRSRISLSEEHELRYWTHEFGVTESHLRGVIDRVGNSVAAVRRHFDGHA